MGFDELIAVGWADHDRDPAATAAALERHAGDADSGERAGRLLALANHVMGEVLGDWDRAFRLGRRVVAAPLGEGAGGAGLVPALANFAFAAHLAGHLAPALAAQVRAASLSPGDAIAVMVRVDLLVAEALARQGRWDECLELLVPTLDLSLHLGEGSSADRTVAVVANNVASALLDLPERSAAQETAMLRTAGAARTFWLRAGDWTNEERADYLLALVAAAVGRPAEALEHASRGLAVIDRNGDEPVDRAFLLAARARAARDLGRPAEQASDLAAAEALAATVAGDPALSDWLARELARAR